jgi:hypothetical protein
MARSANNSTTKRSPGASPLGPTLTGAQAGVTKRTNAAGTGQQSLALKARRYIDININDVRNERARGKWTEEDERKWRSTKPYECEICGERGSTRVSAPDTFFQTGKDLWGMNQWKNGLRQRSRWTERRKSLRDYGLIWHFQGWRCRLRHKGNVLSTNANSAFVACSTTSRIDIKLIVGAPRRTLCVSTLLGSAV